MSNSVIFKQKIVEVEGKEYTLQKIPFKFYIDIMDRNKNANGVLQMGGYSEELFKHVVIAPKVKLNDFNDDFQAGFKLVKEIENFLSSKAESNTDKAESEEELQSDMETSSR